MKKFGGGYSCMRQSASNNYVEVYGHCSIPEYYAASPSTGTYPEIFFGFYYGAYGIDMGIINRNGDLWNLASNALSTTSTVSWHESTKQISLSPGQQVYVWAYLDGEDLVGRFSTIGRDDTNPATSDQLRVPLISAAATRFNRYGAVINREIALASNSDPEVYLHSGAYLGNGKWNACGLTTTTGYTYTWTPNLTGVKQPEYGRIPIYVPSTSKQLCLRNDDGNTDRNIISAVAGTDSSGAATETASITF